jgi:hypothetical protein
MAFLRISAKTRQSLLRDCFAAFESQGLTIRLGLNCMAALK